MAWELISLLLVSFQLILCTLCQGSLLKALLSYTTSSLQTLYHYEQPEVYHL